MNHTSISIVPTGYIDGASQKLKFQIFYFTAMNLITLDTLQPLRRYPKSYKQVFGSNLVSQYSCVHSTMRKMPTKRKKSAKKHEMEQNFIV